MNTLRIAVFACALLARSIVAQATFPHATLTFKVVNEDGHALAGALIAAGFEVPKKDGLGTMPKGATMVSNSDGSAKLSGATANGYVTYGVQCSGYYPAENLAYQFKKFDAVQWLPENPGVSVVLKKIVNPIPMYARHMEVEIPVTDSIVGFDLVVGDWVAPYGRGIRGDWLAKVTREYHDRKNHHVTLEIAFPNEKDGFSPFVLNASPGQGSLLRLPRIAPESGYKNQLKTSIRRQPGAPTFQDAKSDMNYFYRVRTILDEKGEIRSSLYGKIHGDIVLAPMNSKTCKIIFDYYLNAVANDRNVEWDSKRNLAVGLGEEQKLTAP